MRRATFSILTLIVLIGCGRGDSPAEDPGSGALARAGHTGGFGVGSDSTEAKPTAEGEKLGKRMGPRDVAPVTIGNTWFVVIHWGKRRGFEQNGGYIAAEDAASDAELWTLKIYDVEYRRP